MDNNESGSCNYNNSVAMKAFGMIATNSSFFFFCWLKFHVFTYRSIVKRERETRWRLGGWRTAICFQDIPRVVTIAFRCDNGLTLR